VWGQKIPKLLSDSQIKLVDMDRDGIDDVIIGTGTGECTLGELRSLGRQTCAAICHIFSCPTEIEDAARSARSCNREYHYVKTDKCLGGVIALNGKTGSMLWKLWLTRMVLGVHCDFEINGDGVADCVITGKSGVCFSKLYGRYESKR